MTEIARYVFGDILKRRWLLAYVILFFASSCGLFHLTGSSSKTIASLLDLVVLIIPLVALLFGLIYFYSSRPFLELLLTQPVKRRTIFLGYYLGLSLPLVLAFLLGLGLFFILYGSTFTGEFENIAALLSAGTFLTFSFTALALLIAVIIDEKVQGVAVCILLWLYLSIFHDGLILITLMGLNEYPMDKVAVILCALDPVTMARVLILLKLDISALMGCAGALYQNFLGSSFGIGIACSTLFLWTLCPLSSGLRFFERKDF